MSNKINKPKYPCKLGDLIRYNCSYTSYNLYDTPCGLESKKCILVDKKTILFVLGFIVDKQTEKCYDMKVLYNNEIWYKTYINSDVEYNKIKVIK